ncbi:MAG TPA: hypothetical protein PLQ59_06575 [Fervidobacterium sp.]|mgnify:CR=1 FL=1|nr:hypothetical protein [Fervidobacterium sp.]HQQ17263.1 hypothetical protein [Fervidobacterium sp.]
MRMQENRVSFNSYQERINEILNNLEDTKKKNSEIVKELRNSTKTFIDETTPESEFTFSKASDYFIARRNEKLNWLVRINTKVDSDFKTAFNYFDAELDNLEHTIDQCIHRESELSTIKQKSNSQFRSTVNTLEHIKDKVKKVDSLYENIKNVYSSVESSTGNFDNVKSNIISQMSFYQSNGFVKSLEEIKGLFSNIEQNEAKLSSLITNVSVLDMNDKLYNAIVYLYLEKLKSVKSSYDYFSRTNSLELAKKMHTKIEEIFAQAKNNLESEIMKVKGSKDEFQAIYERFKFVNENIDYFVKEFDYVDRTLRMKYNIQEFNRTIKMVSTYKDILLNSVKHTFLENAKSLFKSRYNDFFTTFTSMNIDTFEGQLVSLSSQIKTIGQDLKNYLEFHYSFFEDSYLEETIYKYLISEFEQPFLNAENHIALLLRKFCDICNKQIESLISEFQDLSSNFLYKLNEDNITELFTDYISTYQSLNSSIANIKTSYENSSEKCDEMLKSIYSEFKNVFGFKLNYSIGTLYTNHDKKIKRIVNLVLFNIRNQITSLLKNFKDTLDGRIDLYIDEFRNLSSNFFNTMKLENLDNFIDSYISKYNALSTQINQTFDSYQQTIKDIEDIKLKVKEVFKYKVKYSAVSFYKNCNREILEIIDLTLSNLESRLTSLMATLKNDYDSQIRSYVEKFRNTSRSSFDGLNLENATIFFNNYIQAYNTMIRQIDGINNSYKQTIQNIENEQTKIKETFGYELNYHIADLDQSYKNEINNICKSVFSNTEHQMNSLLRTLQDTCDTSMDSYVRYFRDLSLKFFDEMNMDNANELFKSYNAEYNSLTTRIAQTVSSYEQNIAIIKGIVEKLKNVFGYDLKYQNYNLSEKYKEQAKSIYISTIGSFGKLFRNGMEKLKNDILAMKNRYEEVIISEQLESFDDIDEINIYLKRILAIYYNFVEERNAVSSTFLQKNNDIIHDTTLSSMIKNMDFNSINIASKILNDKVDLIYQYVESMIKPIRKDFDEIVEAMTHDNKTLISKHNLQIIADVKKFKEVYTKMRDATIDFAKSPLLLNVKEKYSSYVSSISSAYSSFVKKTIALMNEHLKNNCISLLNLYVGNLEDLQSLYNEIVHILREDGADVSPMTVNVNEYRKKFIEGCKQTFFTHFVAEVLRDAEILSYQEFEKQAKDRLILYSENVEDIRSYYNKYLIAKFERIIAKCTTEDCIAISDEDIKNNIIKLLSSCSEEHFAMIFSDERISLFFKMHMLNLYFENINNNNENFNDNKCFIINFLIDNLKSKEASILDKNKLREHISDEAIDACNVSWMKKMGFRSFLGRGMTSGGIKQAFRNLSNRGKKNEKD